MGPRSVIRSSSSEEVSVARRSGLFTSPMRWETMRAVSAGFCSANWLNPSRIELTQRASLASSSPKSQKDVLPVADGRALASSCLGGRTVPLASASSVGVGILTVPAATPPPNDGIR